MPDQSLRAVRNFYRQLDQQQLPARLIRDSDNLGEWEQIVIIRHAQPDLERRRRYSAEEAHQFTRAYDEAPIIPFTEKTFELAAEEIPQVYTSNLIRSIQTAIALFGEAVPLIPSPLFRELERQVPQILGQRKLSKPLWSLIYRGPYFLGKRYDQIEGFTQARVRFRKAAVFLEKAAAKDGAAIVVAHGLFNFFLGRALQSRRWQKVKSSGFRYLGVTIYTRPKH